MTKPHEDFQTYYPSITEFTDLSEDEIYCKYPYQVEINLTNKTLLDTMKPERWCEEHFGKLDEYNSKCCWQVVYKKSLISKNKLKEQLIFLFCNKNDALLFKLTWT